MPENVRDEKERRPRIVDRAFDRYSSSYVQSTVVASNAPFSKSSTRTPIFRSVSPPPRNAKPFGRAAILCDTSVGIFVAVANGDAAGAAKRRKKRLGGKLASLYDPGRGFPGACGVGAEARCLVLAPPLVLPIAWARYNDYWDAASGTHADARR